MISVLCTILDDAAPRVTALDRIPQVPESPFRHIRMTDDIVILPDQLFTCKTAYLNERIVRIGDGAFCISL